MPQNLKILASLDGKHSVLKDGALLNYIIMGHILLQLAKDTLPKTQERRKCKKQMKRNNYVRKISQSDIQKRHWEANSHT